MPKNYDLLLYPLLSIKLLCPFSKSGQSCYFNNCRKKFVRKHAMILINVKLIFWVYIYNLLLQICSQQPFSNPFKLHFFESLCCQNPDNLKNKSTNQSPKNIVPVKMTSCCYSLQKLPG